MKKLLTAMTAVSALMAAAPAAAQTGYQNPNNGYGNGYNNGYRYNNGYNANANGAVSIDNRLARIAARIDAGVQNGTIDPTEARNLRWQLNQISRLDRQYGRNGYTQQERADMQQRLRAFRDQLAAADGGRYGNGYGSNGYGNGYGQNGYGNGYGQNGYNNGYGGQGGPYEDVYCEDTQRSGIGGLIDSIFGGGSDESCSSSYGLRVGQRVSGNLGSVPWQYRSQYRDGSGYYYRSDGRSIYRIDARTQTVVGVYPIDR